MAVLFILLPGPVASWSLCKNRAGNRRSEAQRQPQIASSPGVKHSQAGYFHFLQDLEKTKLIRGKSKRNRKERETRALLFPQARYDKELVQ